MNLKIKISKENTLVILVITQFVLIALGGYFIYGNYERNISQSKNIKQLSSNAQVIKENTNNRIENVESAVNDKINNLSVSLSATIVDQTSKLDTKISDINTNLNQKINSIPEGPPGPQGPRGPRGYTGPAGTLSSSDRSTIDKMKQVLGGSGIFSGNWSSWRNRDLIEIDECLDAIKSYITSYYGSSRAVSYDC